MAQTHVTITVEFENTSEVFWGNFFDAMPAIADELSKDGHTTVAVETWEKIQAIEGFSGGPDYAPTSLIEVG